MGKRFSLFALIMLIMVIALMSMIALAQITGAPHDEIKLGHYALPLILMVALAVIYRVSGDSISDRIKPLIALGVGVVLDLIALHYAELALTFKNMVDYLPFGFKAGASAIGLYEGKKA